MFKPRLRKPRFRRCADSAPLSITERDVLILSLVNRYSLIASDHLRRLIDGSRQHLIRRLGRLYHAGYLDRPRAQLFLSRRCSHSFAYVLAKAGRDALHERGLRTQSAAPRFKSVTSCLSLAHSLRVADVVSYFEATAMQRGWRFLPHHHWFGEENASSRLSQFRWKVRLRERGRRIDTWLIPDAAFALKIGLRAVSYFLVEYDRGTMPVHRSSLNQSSFHRKLLAYIESRRSGVLWKQFGVPDFRVLVITESRKRMKNLQAAAASLFQGGESGMFLFASLDDSNPGLFLDRDWEKCSGAKVPLLK